MIQKDIGIVGGGRAGVALGAAFRAVGWHIGGCWSRTEKRATSAGLRLGCESHWGDQPLPASPILLIAVSDDALPTIAKRIPSTAAVVLHTSGAMTSQVLVDGGCTCSVGSFHPLQAMPDAHNHDDTYVANRLFDSWVAVEGTVEGLELAKTMASDLSAHAVEVSAKDKVLYHAGAVLLSNYMVTLFAEAQRLFDLAGLDPTDGKAMLLRLASSALENLEHVAAPQALTGPIRRGDVKTVERHLEAFDSRGLSEVAMLYRSLLKPTVSLATHTGLPPGVAAVLQSMGRE